MFTRRNNDVVYNTSDIKNVVRVSAFFEFEASLGKYSILEAYSVRTSSTGKVGL